MIVIGVDVGGTSIKGGAINDKGQVLDEFVLGIDRLAKPEVTFSELADAINEFIKEHHYEEKISGVGLGIPGLIDKETGIVASSPNMPLWLNFNIKEFLSSRLGLPIKIVNDASAAALGEARFGSGKEFNYLVMFTLGTGVGGGIVFNKQLIDGNKSQGAQLGHSIIVLNGRKCNCGRRGCLEAYASATALSNQTRIMMRQYPNSLLHECAKEVGKINAKVAFMAARRGDEAGMKLVTEYVMYLSEGILNYCNIFRPDVVVLSGGVANEGDYLINRVRDYIERRDYGYKNSPKVVIKQAELGYDAGKIGAASLFFE